MSLTITWESQKDKDIDSIEIYRKSGHAKQTISPNNPGTPIATLGKEATSYVDNDVVDKTVYHYWIVNVKGTNRTFNFPIVQGFFLNTGPGPQTLKRGNWWAGWFGKVSNAEMFTATEVRGLVPKLTMFTWNADYWDKFVYKGSILFIPNKAMVYAHPQAVYQAGILFGTNDSGPGTVPGGAAGVNQMTKIQKNGFEYIIRAPRINDNTAANLTPGALYVAEWRSTVARLWEMKGSYATSTVEGKLDYRVSETAAAGSRTRTFFANWYSSNAYWLYVDLAAPEYSSYIAWSSNDSMIPVFELVPQP